MMSYIRGLFSWLFGGWEVTERLGRHRASLAKPYLVMAAYKSTFFDYLYDFSFIEISSLYCSLWSESNEQLAAATCFNERAAVYIPPLRRSVVPSSSIASHTGIHLLSACTITRRVFSIHFRRILRKDMVKNSHVARHAIRLTVHAAFIRQTRWSSYQVDLNRSRATLSPLVLQRCRNRLFLCSMADW